MFCLEKKQRDHHQMGFVGMMMMMDNDDDDDDCFYIALFFALEQTYCTRICVYMSDLLFIVHFWISIGLVY